MVRRIILTIGFAALAASALAQQSGVPIGLPDTRRIEAFSNGDIRHSSSADVYFMVVQATDNAGQFWLQCEKRGQFTVAVAMIGATDKLQRSQVVTIRPDDGAVRKLDLIVFENFVAIATRFEGRADENASVFMETRGRDVGRSRYARDAARPAARPENRQPPRKVPSSAL